MKKVSVVLTRLNITNPKEWDNYHHTHCLLYDRYYENDNAIIRQVISYNGKKSAWHYLDHISINRSTQEGIAINFKDYA